MNRGRIVIAIILVVALAAAGFSLWYHYRSQYRAQRFWGTATARLIDKAPKVEVLALGEVGRNISLDEDSPSEPAADDKAKGGDDAEKPNDPDAPPPPQAVEFDGIPWLVLETKDGTPAKGVANLRRALVIDSTFDWTEAPADAEPHWQYGISVNDGRDWATILFDFKSRRAGLTGGRKTVLLDPEANKDFQQFFAEQFPKPPAEKAVESDADKKPGQPAESTGDKPDETPVGSADEKAETAPDKK